jgi:hypothetical protein
MEDGQTRTRTGSALHFDELPERRAASVAIECVGYNQAKANCMRFLLCAVFFGTRNSRATDITDYLTNGGRLEVAQYAWPGTQARKRLGFTTGATMT